MSLLERLSSADDIYFSAEFMSVLDSCMQTLIDSVTSGITVEPLDAYRFEGDFYGLLAYLGIQQKYHYVVMRVNGFRSPSDYGDTSHTETRRFYVAVPDYQEVERILNSYRSQK